MNKIEKKIKALKKEAKKEYLAYYADAGEYDCGLNLAEHLSLSCSSHKIKFNQIMDELSKLDPKITPKRQ